MNLTLQITGSPAELSNVLVGLNGLTTPNAPIEPAPVDNLAPAKTVKAKTVETPKPEPVQAQETKPESQADTVVDSGEEITDEQLRAIAQPKVKSNMAGVKALLEGFGAKSLTSVPQDKRAELIEKIKAL